MQIVVVGGELQEGTERLEGDCKATAEVPSNDETALKAKKRKETPPVNNNKQCFICKKMKLKKKGKNRTRLRKLPYKLNSLNVDAIELLRVEFNMSHGFNDNIEKQKQRFCNVCFKKFLKRISDLEQESASREAEAKQQQQQQHQPPQPPPPPPHTDEEDEDEEEDEDDEDEDEEDDNDNEAAITEHTNLPPSVQCNLVADRQSKFFSFFSSNSVES